MPKIPIDYNNNIIYKIVCNDLSVKECYIGHTINMTKQKYKHKFICHNEKNKHHNLKIYQIIRKNGGWSNWSMILVEKFPCKDKPEACKRKRELYEELGAKMNTRIPYLTQEEYNQNCKQYHKQYREDHKEEKKEYREKHKAEYKEYQKKYREDHKAEINKTIECEYCSKLLSKRNMYRHIKICKSKE